MVYSIRPGKGSHRSGRSACMCVTPLPDVCPPPPDLSKVSRILACRPSNSLSGVAVVLIGTYHYLVAPALVCLVYPYLVSYFVSAIKARKQPMICTCSCVCMHTHLPVSSGLVPADILGHCLVSSPFRISTGILSKYVNGGVENVLSPEGMLYYIIG